jgi:ribonuclease HI
VKVVIYTDGSSKGNPGPGGYGAVLISEKGHRKELSEGFRKTTNNRMELMAVIKALEALKKPCEVIVFSDSKYVVDSVVKGWVFEWEKKGFSGKKNPDLWKRFLKVFRRHRVHFEWVKGHDGIDLNERCDQLAVKASERKELKVDEGYENTGNSELPFTRPK